MEVGAVKQAFNNEVILLKKKLNQAKTQTIHKLTRKAKQLTEKKAPEALKEKLKRKAESAVKEVLIIKKIKPKDLAEFIVTHKGGLNEFLNKPEVNNEKACARLLLHKALQDKYKLIRNKFSDIPIKDLFMSRLERRKMKKEAKDKQKKKKDSKSEKDNKDGKDKVVNAEGDWSVEDVKMDEGDENSDDGSDSQDENDEVNGDEVVNDKVNVNKISDEEVDDDSGNEEDENDSNDDDEKSNESDDNSVENDNDDELEEEPSIEVNKNIKKVSKVDKTSSENITNAFNREDTIENSKGDSKSIPATKNKVVIPHVEVKPTKTIELKKKNPKNKQKELNKTKQFNEKINLKKANKDSIAPVTENKMVDPFFMTATGENYMSVVEPRAPDEIKDEHRQGNRKLRRAVMFGHVPKSRLRQDRRQDERHDQRQDRQNNSRFNNDDNNFRNKNREDFNKKDDRNKFNNKKDFNNDRGYNKNSRNDTENVKEEKLHPSWEAKKKKSGILPFEGKKIVFD